MRDYFSDILDEGEKVAAYFKPVKRKFFLAAILMYCVIGLIVMGFATLAIILPIGAVGSHAPIYRFIPLAVFGSVIIGVMLLVFVNHKSHQNPYMLVLQCADTQAEQAALSYLKAQTQRCVVKSKAAQAGNIELNVEVRLKSEDTSFVNGLAATPGVSSAVLVSYNGDYMG